MRCNQQIAANGFCHRLIADDSDYVILEDGKTILCEQCVDVLLDIPIPARDGFEKQPTMKAEYCATLGVIRAKRIVA